MLEVVVDPGRGPVLVKRAASADDGDRLAHEAAVLRSLAGRPDFVQLLSHVGSDADTELRLRYVGPHTLATVGPLPPLEVAGLMAALAESVADLHRVGFVHTRLTPDHILLGPGGRPVVGGLAGAGGPNRCSPAGDVAALGTLLQGLLADDELLGEPIPERRRWTVRRRWSGYHRQTLLMLADQATADEHASRPTAHALAETIRAAFPDSTLPSPTPRRRDDSTTPPSPVTTAPPKGAGHAAGHPGAVEPDEPRSPPEDPAAFDAAPQPRAPTLRAPTVRAPSPPPVRSPHDRWPDLARRGWPVLAVVLGMALLLVGFHEVTTDARSPATVTASSGERPLPPAPPLSNSTTRPPDRMDVPTTMSGTAPDRPRPAAAASPTTGQDGTSPTPPTTGSPTTVAPPSRAPATSGPTNPDPVRSPGRASCPPAGAPAADVDGDGCLDAYRVRGTQVTAGGITYQVGQPGDLITVGDWDCDGHATPALLRTGTGEVFVFRGWASEKDDVTVRPVSTVPGGTGLQAGDTDADGCPQLTVQRGSNPPAVIAVGAGG